MEEEFISYRKFADKESAEEISNLLNEAAIPYELRDNTQLFIKVVGPQDVDLGYVISLHSKDFTIADVLVEAYYSKHLENVDKDYYLFEFTDQELKNVLLHPYEWGYFDKLLAKKLLKEKGIEYDDAYIEKRKSDTLAKLSETKKIELYQYLLGYAFTAIIPIIGVAMGLIIMNNRNVLPTGEKVYAHPASDRRHGQTMLIISIAWACVSIVIAYRRFVLGIPVIA